MPNTFRHVALATALGCAPLVVLGADFDGSKPLICATAEANDCWAGDSCDRGLPQSVGLPLFMRIDFAQKTIAGPNRTTPIVSLIKDDRQLLLQGNEQGFGWTIAIDAQDGSMTASLVTDHNAIAVFGACTPI